MGERRPTENETLGKRDKSAREVASFAQFLRRARAIGFSDAEIDRLRSTYGQATLEFGDEHLGGRKSS